MGNVGLNLEESDWRKIPTQVTKVNWLSKNEEEVTRH